MFKDPKVGEYITGAASKAKDKEIRNILKDTQDAFLFAVSHEEDRNRKMCGWIQFAPDEKQRVSRIRDLKDNTARDTLILEVSFARYFSPKIKRHIKGLISSGVRQACIRIKELEDVYAQTNGRRPRKVVVNAYVHKGNEPSLRVLEHSGFVKKGLLHYRDPNRKTHKDDLREYYYRLHFGKLFQNLKIS